MSVADIPTDEYVYVYRGDRVRVHSLGPGYARVVPAGELTAERFPEALEFSSQAEDPWVKLPLTAFDEAYRQIVHARWHGVPVRVAQRIVSGPDRGRVEITYAGTSPRAAAEAGMEGDSRLGFWAYADPADVEVVEIETVPQSGSDDD